MKIRKMLALLLCFVLAAALTTGCASKDGDSGKKDPEKQGDETEASVTPSSPSGTGITADQVKDKELRLFTWDGMFPQDVIDRFQDETGIRIYYSNFDYDEDMLAKLEETQGREYDLVIADDYIIEVAIKEGLVQKLDKAKIGNFSNINSLYQGQFYDPQDEYTVPYGAGIPLIIYDPALVDFEIKSYADLWNPKLKSSIAIIGNHRVINGITLKTMGESFNTQDLEVIQKAGNKLLELAPNIRLINDNNTQDFIISGEASVAFLYTSQINMALMQRPELKTVYPEEGLGFGVMAAFIPSKAPNSDAAHLFLQYLLEPEVGAECSEYIGYYSTNRAADEYISDDMKDKLVVPASIKDGEIIQNLSPEAEELHLKLWTEFKSKCE